MREKVYKELIKQVDILLDTNNEVITNISLFLSLIKENIPLVSWVGIYYYNNEKQELFLGPFQGKTACTRIRIGKGVCGEVALTRKTIIVKNVHEYPNHISCDSLSCSEIVLPIVHNNILYGVLDLDSYEINNFENIDGENLYKLIEILIAKTKGKII